MIFFSGMAIDKNGFFARTMHTPDSPERAELRAALRDISKTLIPLHRALINAVRDDYAFAFGEVESPGRLLQLVKDDPFFAWLKPMTSLIVDIDEMARVDFDDSDAKAIADRLDQLFGAAASASFAERYVPLLQREVEVAIAHAAVRKTAQKLRK